MSEVLLEAAIGTVISIIIMIVHELSKSIVYKIIRCRSGSVQKYSHSIFEVWRYIDPVGVILGVISYAPVSKPHMFRIRDKKTNLMLGITGFVVLILIFTGSITVLKCVYGGNEGVTLALNSGIYSRIIVLLWKYTAILSFGMFIVNLFPVSTFDMGLVIAGISARHYLQIIKSDSVIKMILLITLLLDMIQYGGMRLLNFII